MFTLLNILVAGWALAQQRAAGEPAAPDNPYVPPACAGIFADVACPGGFAVTWIEHFYNEGITAGCNSAPLQYCPDSPVTRAQMAVFVEKAMHGTGSWTPGDLGNYNTGLGAASLPFSTTGVNDTAVGWSALSSDTSGMNNTAVGAESLRSNTTGNYNTGVGTQSLPQSTSADNNTAVGAGTLGLNTTAGRNTAVGASALLFQSYDPGGPWDSYNTAVGAYALYANQPDGGNGNVNGTENTAVGDSSLTSNTTGYRNTAVGNVALTAATTGSADTAVGMAALMATTTGFDNTALGWKAGARGGDSITGYAGSPIVLVSNVTGSYNTFVSVAGATAQVSNCTAVGMDAYCDADNEVRLGNVFVASIGGKVGWSALSDARAKSDVRDLDLGLEFVLALRPVSFRYNVGNGRTDMGFVAQDVEQLLGDGYNVLGIGGDRDRTLSLRYTDLIAPMVKAIQEQQATIEAQRAQIEELTTALAERDGALERRMEALERRIQ